MHGPASRSRSGAWAIIIIITHGFRQQPEVVNLLEDNELKGFVG